MQCKPDSSTPRGKRPRLELVDVDLCVDATHNVDVDEQNANGEPSIIVPPVLPPDVVCLSSPKRSPCLDESGSAMLARAIEVLEDDCFLGPMDALVHGHVVAGTDTWLFIEQPSGQGRLCSIPALLKSESPHLIANMRNGSPPSYVLVPCRTDYEPISDTLHDMNHWVVGLKREDDVSAETFENMQRQDLEDKLAAVDAHCEPSMADDIKKTVRDDRSQWHRLCGVGHREGWTFCETRADGSCLAHATNRGLGSDVSSEGARDFRRTLAAAYRSIEANVDWQRVWAALEPGWIDSVSKNTAFTEASMSATASAEQPIARIDVVLVSEPECSVAGFVATKSATTETVDPLAAHGITQPIDGLQDEASIREAAPCASNLVRAGVPSASLPREEDFDVASQACNSNGAIDQGTDCLATVADATRGTVAASDLGAEGPVQIEANPVHAGAADGTNIAAVTVVEAGCIESICEKRASTETGMSVDASEPIARIDVGLATEASSLPREEEFDEGRRAYKGHGTIVQGTDCLANLGDATRETVIASDLGAEGANQTGQNPVLSGAVDASTTAESGVVLDRPIFLERSSADAMRLVHRRGLALMGGAWTPDRSRRRGDDVGLMSHGGGSQTCRVWKARVSKINMMTYIWRLPSASRESMSLQSECRQ